MDKVGICIAGYGNFGKKLHSYLDQMDECEVKYLYHPDDAKAKLYGVLGISNLDTVLRDGTVGIFIIATPNDQHLDLLARLYYNRHHIFVEKPTVTHIADAYFVDPRTAFTDRVFMVGHCQRRESVYRKAKELLDAGAIGKVVNVNFNLSHGGAFTISPNDWRASVTRNDLGPLAMLGSHCIDTIHYLFGKVESVYAKLARLSGKTEAPDMSSVILNLENGATVFLQNNYIVPGEKYCFISGTEGVIYIDNGRIWLRSGCDHQEGGKFIRSENQELEIIPVDPIEEELKEFISAIRNGTKVETGYREGLEVVKVLEACRTSARENKLKLLS